MSSVEVVRESGIATVTLRNPPVNALSRRVLRELVEVFDAFAEDRSAAVVVLRADGGGRAFIGGADLKEFDSAGPAGSLVETVDPGQLGRAAFHAIRHCAVPVVAAVDKAVIGGGLAVVGSCDVVVAAESATFGLTEINVGLLGASAYLTRLVGPATAREMFLTGRMATAAEFAARGAIARVVPDAELHSAVAELAAELVAKSPLALRLAKESMNRVEHLPLEEAYHVEQEYTARLRTLDDSREAREAFFDKRRPRWTWR